MGRDNDQPLSHDIHAIADSLRDQAVLLDQDLADQLQRCADMCEDYAMDLNRLPSFE